MSRRTSESNKAILAAWNKEQELVKSGKGTRAWTPEQQKDILEKGKAYDDNGKSFEGQHMKSADAYPEFQGDPGNIQFLTRTEHLEAHDGNWKNPTNWYFNPVTKEKIDFGDGPFIPCEIVQLPEPLITLQIEQKENQGTDQESVKDTQLKDTQLKVERKEKRKSSQKLASSRSGDVKSKALPVLGQKIQRWFKKGGKAIVEFPVKHPTATKNIISTLRIAISIGISALYEKSNSESSGSEYTQSDDNGKDDCNQDELKGAWEDYSTDDDDSKASERPYTPNDVPAGKQRYYYKDGSIKWKDKQPYHRGGNKDE